MVKAGLPKYHVMMTTCCSNTTHGSVKRACQQNLMARNSSFCRIFVFESFHGYPLSSHLFSMTISQHAINNNIWCHLSGNPRGQSPRLQR
jgi:hypothetical protein